MNILQVGSGAIKIPPENYGGVELYIYRISAHMVRAGHDVTILDIKKSQAEPDIEYIDGIKFVRVHTPRAGATFRSFRMNSVSTRINTFLFSLKVSHHIRKDNFDIIHFHSTLIGFILTFLNGRLRGKMVYTVHSPGWFILSTGRLDRLALSLDCRLIRRVGKIIAVSDLLKEKLIATSKVNPERVVIVHPGAETSEFSPDIDTGDVKPRYGLEGRIIILFNGRIVPYKGVEYLVKAADIVVNNFGYKDALFLLVGPLAGHELDKVEHADYVSRIFSFIKAQGLEAHVKFTGVVPSAELPGLYSACDIFVLPSLAETFGQVISQAMASGKPIIGTRIAGILTQVSDGWNGYLVEPANEHQLAEKVKYLIDHPEERRRMGLNGRKFAEDEFEWSLVSNRILHVYQAVTGNRNG